MWVGALRWLINHHGAKAATLESRRQSLVGEPSHNHSFFSFPKTKKRSAYRVVRRHHAT